jgi:hypothetical protein
LKVETVPELVQEHHHKVGVRTVVVIQSQVEVEVAAELSVDIVSGWVQVSTSALIREGTAIKCTREFSSRKGTHATEVAESLNGARASENAGSEWVEGSLNPDDLIAVQGRGPDVSGMLERDKPLLSEGCAGVAAYGRRWRWIVESLARPICIRKRERFALVVCFCIVFSLLIL